MAQPIEQQVNGVDNMLYMQSTSGADGSYTLTVTFTLGTDPDINTVNVQNRVSLAEPLLPDEVSRQGLTVKKVSSALLQVVQLYSPKGTYDALYLSNYATINVIDALKRINGVGDATLFGPLDYSMRVWLDPDKLTNLQLSAQRRDRRDPARRTSRPRSAGSAPRRSRPTSSSSSRSPPSGRLTSDGAVRQHRPARQSGRLGGPAQGRRAGRARRQVVGAVQPLQRQPAAAIGIYQSPGANAVQVAERVRATMAELGKRFPDDLDYDVFYDTTLFVKATMEEVVKTLLEAFVLVALVVFLFLGKLRTTLIPIIAVPVSLIGTFAVLLLIGYSANTVSLLALVLAIGIVVDDAIVVIENVERVMEEEPHLSPKEATKKAMAEITGPIIAITLVLLSVFVPVAFIPGISGQLFRQFAVAVSVSMLISAINALTLSPALCSVLLKPGHIDARPDALRAERHRLHARRLCRGGQAAGARRHP